MRTDGFTVYVASLRTDHKTGEIAANPAVELCWLSGDHDQIRVDDRVLLEQIWTANPLLRHYLGTLDLRLEALDVDPAGGCCRWSWCPPVPARARCRRVHAVPS